MGHGDTNLTAIIVAALLVAVGPLIGFLAARSKHAVQGHEESELRFGPVVTGLSAAAAGNSTFIMIGAVGLGYTMGLSALWIPWSYWVGDILFWYLVASKLVRRVQTTGVDTIAELVAHQTVNRSSLPLRVAAIVTILAISLFCAAQFLAVGKVSSQFLGLPFHVTVAGAIIVGLLSIGLGGLGSSMLVNVYQAVLKLGAAIIFLLFIGYAMFTDGAALSPTPSHTHLLNIFDGFSGIGLPLLMLTFILSGLLYTTCSPHVLTRITKGNVDEIPRMRWIYMGFTQSLWQTMTLAGVALALLGTHSADPDKVGILYAQSVMPVVILGMFFAGIVAASMSTAEAQILVIANSLAMDLAPNSFERMSGKAKYALLITLRIGVAVALYIALISLDLNTVSSLVIQSGAILFAAFAVPATIFIFQIPVGGIAMALIILSGGLVTFLTRSYTSWPLGHEIFPGLATAIIVFGIARLLGSGKVDREHEA